MVRNLPANAGDTGLIPGIGRSPGEENGNLLQYSGLENPMDRRTEAWKTIIHGVTHTKKIKLYTVNTCNCRIFSFYFG